MGRGAPEGPRSKARGTEGRPEEGGEGLEDFYTIRYTDLAAPNFYLQAGGTAPAPKRRRAPAVIKTAGARRLTQSFEEAYHERDRYPNRSDRVDGGHHGGGAGDGATGGVGKATDVEDLLANVGGDGSILRLFRHINQVLQLLQ